MVTGGTLEVRVEVWALQACADGVRVAPGLDPWRSTPITADSSPHAAVEALLLEQGLREVTQVIHSTSWRAEQGHVVLTYVAVPGPAAPPLRGELLDEKRLSELGPPVEHAPDQAPVPQIGQVLVHAVRHVRFLLDTDPRTRDALGPHWVDRLSRLSPTVAGEPDVAAAPGIDLPRPAS